METPEPKHWLVAWFGRRAPHISMEATRNYFDAGAIDSLGVIELIEDAETSFGVRFSQSDFQDRRFPTIDGLADIIREKLGQ